MDTTLVSPPSLVAVKSVKSVSVRSVSESVPASLVVAGRADDLAADLDENFGDPEAIQLTTYQPRPQSGMAQHFDSRARFLSIATMSLRACVKLVQIRGPKDRKKGGQERSEIRLLPRSIYVMSGPARANCHIKDIAAVQATKNHGDCPCCWTHGIDTDQAEAQGRIGVTFRQLAPWALPRVSRFGLASLPRTANGLWNPKVSILFLSPLESSRLTERMAAGAP